MKNDNLKPTSNMATSFYMTNISTVRLPYFSSLYTYILLPKQQAIHRVVAVTTRSS